jgi:hypothetical protein
MHSVAAASRAPEMMLQNSYMTYLISCKRHQSLRLVAALLNVTVLLLFLYDGCRIAKAELDRCTALRSRPPTNVGAYVACLKYHTFTESLRHDGPEVSADYGCSYNCRVVTMPTMCTACELHCPSWHWSQHTCRTRSSPTPRPSSNGSSHASSCR